MSTGFGWQDSMALLRHLAGAGGHRDILIIAHDFPAAFNEPELRVTFVGPLERLPPLKCEAAALHRCHHADAIPAILAAVASSTTRRHSLVFIDSDHRAEALVAQIESMTPLCTEDALWVFDDAVPPEPGMATRLPGTGWWTGQVYALPHLLQPVRPDAAAAMLPLPPTGLGLFRGHGLHEPNLLRERLAAIPAVPTAADIARLSQLDRPADAAAFRIGAPLSGEGLKLDLTGDAGRTLLEVLEPAHAWHRPAPAGLVLARATPIDTSALAAEDRLVHGSELAELRDVVTLGFDALLHGNTLHGRYRWDWVRHGHAQQLAARGAWGHPPGEPVSSHPDGFYIKPAVLVASETIERPVFWGTPDEGANWGMWLLLTIASAELFLRRRDRYEAFLCWCPLRWQRPFLKTLGIDDGLILPQAADRAVLLRQVGLLQQDARDLVVTPWLRGVIDHFMARLGLPRQEHGSRRIFLSRLSITQQGAYRGLIQEATLVAAMADRGFEIVEPERMTLTEQVALFRDAACVVGLGGAGLFNTIFCPPSAKVVTIESSLEFAPAHANLFASCGMEYGVVLGEPDPTDPAPIQKRWNLGLEEALGGIDAMLRGWGQATR